MPILPTPPFSTPLHLRWRTLMKALGTIVAVATAGSTEEKKLGVMVIILVVSLFAVSFPTLSKHVPFLRIPGIIFFVGKHFGTGVILATAFIHLLDDAFRSLQDRRVEERYGSVGKWTGSIILVSLLAIFLVEYVSTTYVEHLQEKSSAPPTPVPSRPISPARRHPVQAYPSHSHSPNLLSEITPLLAPSAVQPVPVAAITLPPPRSRSPPALGQRQAPTLLVHPHLHAHAHAPQIPAMPIDVLTNSPRVCRMAMARDHVHGPKKCSNVCEEGDEEAGNELEVGHGHHGHGHEHEHERQPEGKPRVGRRRQVVGLLVLQLGIMIHSFVIGLTLSVTSGADFTSLTTAIIFHQLFEGLSLGIRIAGLPPSPKSKPNPDADVDEAEGTSWGRSYFASVKDRIRRMRKSAGSRNVEVRWLKPVLTVLFAITTPVGMGLGMVVWKGKGKGAGGGAEDAAMLLVQGVMSAISAGLLIYAATVEMLAGDFVFGDVEGHHHHHHHHHQHEHEHEPSKCADSGADSAECVGAVACGDEDVRQAELGGELEVLEEELEEGDRGGGEGGDGGGKTAPVGKRVLAVLSLFAGAGMMVLVGLGE